MEKINTLKPDYKVMRMILNQTMRMNGSRATSAVTVKFILQYLLYAIATVPSMLGIMSGRIGLSTILHEDYQGYRDDSRAVDYAFLLGGSGTFPTCRAFFRICYAGMSD